MPVCRTSTAQLCSGMEEENQALLSMGAELHSVSGATCHSDINKLLRCDELKLVGPDLDAWCHDKGGEGKYKGPAERAAGWNGDPSIYFTARETEIVVSFPSKVCLSRIGFMDTPWDRNYGREFECLVSETGNDWVPFGEAPIPDIHVDRGDSSRYPLRNVWVDCGEAPADANFVKFRWPNARDKRIFFLFAVGSPATTLVLNLTVETSDDSTFRVTCLDLAGSEVAAVNATHTMTVGELTKDIANCVGQSETKIKLLFGDVMLGSQDRQKTLSETFASAP